jgi:hypothetical protein
VCRKEPGEDEEDEDGIALVEARSNSLAYAPGDKAIEVWRIEDNSDGALVSTCFR